MIVSCILGRLSFENKWELVIKLCILVHGVAFRRKS